MTTDQRIARRKLSLLELAQDLGNVSRACKLVGYSRQQFYEIRRNYQTVPVHSFETPIWAYAAMGIRPS